MFDPVSVIPQKELKHRWDKCRTFLAETAPKARGLLVFDRLHIYYFTGCLVQGVLWLPPEGEPVLMVRKGVERALLEGGVKNVVSFKSYSHIQPRAAEAGCPLGSTVAVETAGLSWQLGDMLRARVSDVEFVPGDMAIALARAHKSEYELKLMREAGRRHGNCLIEAIPERIRPGMTEREISVICWEEFFKAGHQGLMRMQAHGEEIFLGHVAAGDSGIFPSVFNGPLSLRGQHAAVPYMGNPHKVWEEGEPLALDIGFALAGYHTDKTQCYWAGTPESIPAEVRRAQDFCIEVQDWAASQLKPGSRPGDIYTHVLQLAEERGFAEGFMGLGENQVPFLGHGIGLTVDAFPPVAKGFDRPLELGQCLALEPKQGIPGVGMVGVENTYEVTEQGGRLLTGAPHEFICID